MQAVRFLFHCVLCLCSVKFRLLFALRLASHDEQVHSQMMFNISLRVNSTVKQLDMSFLTFGHGTYAKFVRQICEQAASTHRFTTLHCFTDLPKPVLQAHDWSKHLQFALGYGYWFWKPALAYHILHSMNDGDLLFYADAGTGIRAGSEWNNLTTPFAGPAKAHEAVRIQWNNLAPDAGTNTMALDHFIRQMAQADILAFHLPSFAERTWTKGDIFTEFGVTPDSDYGNTPQICATYFFVKKSSRTIEFMRKWVDLVTNLQLLTSAKSKTPNDKTFRSNRHDQSLFSMMLKANHPVGDLNFLVDGAGIPHFPPDPKHAVPNLKVKVQSRRGLPVVKYGNKRGWLKKRSK
eukprot:gnl/TRDRNA2_/TRDRNA2_169861_c0_seq8.p1 gnl/TRDRNA2_/TRDRNA2_169861_c0~~gnl/TRDRNA2_/TRDRNA2_169861_c0_seq8.p1  ORF type:complete len:349 (-),score=25.10 gnl/TRDRNA2_/TRDRNA2_169861_c0_seq8:49-1095(-)